MNNRRCNPREDYTHGIRGLVVDHTGLLDDFISCFPLLGDLMLGLFCLLNIYILTAYSRQLNKFILLILNWDKNYVRGFSTAQED